jgi:putative PIN family toxin of toxin-antitoxin system
VKVFSDTNVLVAAFATRGLCEDVFRLTLSSHELVLSESVLEELERVLDEEFSVPLAIRADIEALLRRSTVVATPLAPSPIQLRDQDDRWILASAIAAEADVLVSGDKDLHDLPESGGIPLTVMTPREFWEHARMI